MRLNDGLAALPRRSNWRFFPLAVAAAIGVVVAVNGIMVWSALRTFPGKAGQDGFDLSNHYNAIIDRAHAQAALGWTVHAEVDAAGRPVLTLTGPSGTALTGARIEATAQRPVGTTETTRIAFPEAQAGRYVGTATLPAPGQWDLLLSVAAQGHDIATTRRIVVR